MRPSAPSPGNIVGGRYRLEQLLVQGGMGNVWKAHHVSLNAPVAVKFISPLVAEDEEAIGRFLLEAQSAAALRSSHIVQVFDFGIEDGTPFIAMELLQGESLAERLRRKGTLSPTDTGRILSQVARGIQYAHTLGIVHRDLKPDNVFLANEGDHEVAKILDFGIVKAKSSVLRLQASTTTKAGALLGSPYYVSPEQAEGDREIDHRSDLWALGIIAFECLTGTRPFDSEALAALLVKICTHPSPRPSTIAAVPPGFDEWFFHATEKSRERRFQGVREMMDAYAKLLDSTVASLAEPQSIQSEAVSGSLASSPVDAAQFHAKTALSSTPQPASVNGSLRRLERTFGQKRPTNRQVLAGLAAVLLLGLAFAIGRFAQPRASAPTHIAPTGPSPDIGEADRRQAIRTASERDRSAQPLNAPEVTLREGSSPEVALLASGIDLSSSRNAGKKPLALSGPGPLPRIQRSSSPSKTGQVGVSKTVSSPSIASPEAPIPSPTDGLFRRRKVPGETIGATKDTPN